MEFSVKSGHPEKQRTACIVAGVFESRRLSSIAEQLDAISDSYLSNLLRKGDIEGKTGQSLLLHNVPNISSDRVLLIGCGRERELGDQQFRDIIKKTVLALNETGSMDAVCFLTELNVKSRDTAWKIRQAVETTYEALYSFDEYKTKKNGHRRPLRRLVFTVPTRRELALAEKAILEGQAIAKAVTFTKNLANRPPNICTPAYMVEQAEALSQRFTAINVATLQQQEMQALGMGALLAVGAGSENPPYLITMEYQAGDSKQAPIVLVGKGITFDSGGNSLKSGPNMIGMKYDMCGGATVMGVMHAAAELELPLNIVGVIPAVENMPGGSAYRPDDILKTLSGLTIEVLNTDAEGRLILCDALTYCERFQPDVVIDIATLTGACVTALGRHASGLYSNHNPLAHDLLAAGFESGDRAWQMPLWDEYQEQLQSNFADMANIGGPEAGSITAACFLSRFTKKYHWAHLDVAGTACRFTGKEKAATGRPVPLLVQYLLERCKN